MDSSLDFLQLLHPLFLFRLAPRFPFFDQRDQLRLQVHAGLFDALASCDRRASFDIPRANLRG